MADNIISSSSSSSSPHRSCSITTTDWSTVSSSVSCPLLSVRSTCSQVVHLSQLRPDPSVSISHTRLRSELLSHPSLYSPSALPPTWAAWYHYFDRADEETTAQYIFVLDALNFCFWPLPGYQYAELASSLKRVLTADKNAFEASRLLSLSPSTLVQWLQPSPRPNDKEIEEATLVTTQKLAEKAKETLIEIPLIESRCRCLNELGAGLLQATSDGKASSFLRLAGKSASKLVRLLLAHFPAFRDTSVYEGRQIMFYKRVQILVADVYAAFEGKGLGEFEDVDLLTCFPDYRLPQLLRELGILVYGEEVGRRIDGGEELETGGKVEMEIRACTVVIVEEMKRILKKECGVEMKSIQLDWILWERGEKLLKELRPHHKVLTPFY